MRLIKPRKGVSNVRHGLAKAVSKILGAGVTGKSAARVKAPRGGKENPTAHKVAMKKRARKNVVQSVPERRVRGLMKQKDVVKAVPESRVRGLMKQQDVVKSVPTRNVAKSKLSGAGPKIGYSTAELKPASKSRDSGSKVGYSTLQNTAPPLHRPTTQPMARPSLNGVAQKNTAPSLPRTKVSYTPKVALAKSTPPMPREKASKGPSFMALSRAYNVSKALENQRKASRKR